MVASFFVAGGFAAAAVMFAGHLVTLWERRR